MCVFNEQGHTIEKVEVRLVGESPKGISLILITLVRGIRSFSTTVIPPPLEQS